jgi:hypothetical protein
MKLFYNVKGETRKSLVGTISRILNATATYLGAPSFAYEVGLDYRIDKTGTVTGPDNHGLEDALEEMGLEAEASEYDNDGLQPCEVSQEAEAAVEPRRFRRKPNARRTANLPHRRRLLPRRAASSR